jgi:hypothetical protein
MIVQDLNVFEYTANPWKRYETKDHAVPGGACTYPAIADHPFTWHNRCLRISQNKTTAWHYAHELVSISAGDRLVLATQFSPRDQWPLKSTAACKLLGAIDENGAAHISAGFERVSDTVYRASIWDKTSSVVAYSNSLGTIAIDQWYYMVLVYDHVTSGGSADLYIGRILGNDKGGWVTLNASGEAFKNAGSQVRLVHLGQGGEPPLNPTAFDFTDSWWASDVSGEGIPFGWCAKVFQQASADVTPHYDEAGLSASLDDLTSGNWEDTQDNAPFSTGRYDDELWGCVRCGGPEGDSVVHAGADILAAAWNWRVRGIAARQIVDLIWGYANSSDSVAVVTKETSSVQAAAADMEHRVETSNVAGTRCPSSNHMLVQGFGNKDVLGTAAYMLDGFAAVLVRRPINGYNAIAGNGPRRLVVGVPWHHGRRTLT